ncbi:hypothetical protein [Streptomyces sp. NBC_01727]|uniref:hypothetical protein n=1 Tax=unclassified Streptomyces TaxID=2593676 RepID=UPI002E0D2918|nr:hypothetical protein OIE76_30315 [Streptomyces sp. NBC_01727]
MPDPVDHVARLRAEREDAGRAEAARADRPWPVVDPYDSGKDIADDRDCIVPSRT